MDIVIKAAEARGIPCIVCGEMAGSPFYAPVLIGLGATELSMNAGSIAKVRRVVAGIAYEEAVQLVLNIKKCRTAGEAEEAVYESIRSHWSHLFETSQELYKG
jgi:phosphotransferase system enzyme I (PtsI)